MPINMLKSRRMEQIVKVAVNLGLKRIFLSSFFINILIIAHLHSQRLSQVITPESYKGSGKENKVINRQQFYVK